MQTRSLHVTGTTDLVERNFATKLMVATDSQGNARIQQSSGLTLPAEIAAEGASIFSFSPHVAHTFSRVTGKVDPANRYGPAGTLWFDDLKQAYRYPSVNAKAAAPDGETKPLDGSGATIATLISNDVYDADIAAMFDHENWTSITGKPDPVLAGRVYVNGGSGTIDPSSGDFDEASLDTQQEMAARRVRPWFSTTSRTCRTAACLPVTSPSSSRTPSTL